MPGRLLRLSTMDTQRTGDRPRPRLKPRGLPPALEPHGVWAATNPADAALFGTDLLGAHRVHVADDDLAAFGATFHGVLVRDVTLGYLDYGTTVRVVVHESSDHYLVLVPATGTGAVEVVGATVETTPVMAAVVGPGERFELRCGDDTAHLIVRISRTALEIHLSRLLGRTVDRPVSFEPAFDLSSATASRWNFAVQMIHAELFDRGSLLHRGAGLGAVEEFLMSALLDSQPSSTTELLRSDRRTVSRQVETAIDFVERNLAEPITVHDVAEAAGVGVRTLQNLFADELQQTPTRHIRNRRLERARSDLADGSAALGTSVTGVATRWGFTHLGRFSAVYRSRFGESPSQTLRS